MFIYQRVRADVHLIEVVDHEVAGIHRACTKEIKCFKNGRPTSIVVDDFFPCSPNSGLPCYAHVDVQGVSACRSSAQVTQCAELECVWPKHHLRIFVRGTIRSQMIAV